MSLISDVAQAIKDVASEVIEPRFHAVGEVTEKSPGELVTEADRLAEQALSTRLAALLPGVPVVGEEAVAADPRVLDVLASSRDARVWLVDPLDGTGNFVGGSPDYAVMVALVDQGTAVASWMWRPVDQRMYVAERGGGAWCNGERLGRPARASSEASALRGAVLTRFLDADTAAAVERNRSRFAAVVPGRLCAAVDYPLVAEGVHDFVLFWRTLPWDHAPGALLVEECGGWVRHLDGSRYSPAASRPGLLVARDAGTWHVVRDALFA